MDGIRIESISSCISLLREHQLHGAQDGKIISSFIAANAPYVLLLVTCMGKILNCYLTDCTKKSL